MTTSQTEVESRVTELATQAFKTFCEDISGTFGVDTECEQREILSEIVSGLQKHFENLVAVNIIDSEGILDGAFQFILDQEGIFTLGGIIIKLPEERILSNRQNASAELAEGMADAIGELGNLLANSWISAFSERLEGHNHFSHRSPAFIGKPWNKSEGTMGLAGDEEVFFLPYEITVGSYPAFNCGVIFPKTIFGESSDLAPEQTAMIEQDTPEETEENSPEMRTATKKTNSKKSRKVKKGKRKKSKPNEPTAKKASVKITDAGKITEKAKAKKTETDKDDSEQSPAAKKSKGKKTPLREPDVSSGQEDTAPDPNAATNSIDPEETNKESDTIEGSDGEESKQEQPSVEETPAETTDVGEIEEQVQTEQVPEDTADSENAAAEQSNTEESQFQESDVPSNQEDTAPDPNTVTDSTDSEESNKESDTIEGSDGEEFRQEQSSVEETPAETTDAGESQLQEPDVSSDQDDAAQDPNAADGVDDVTAAAPETGEENAMGNIFKAIQKITPSPADLPGQPATGKIFEVIQKMTQSPAVLPGQSTTAEKTTPDITELFEICANDIMQNQITWAGPDDTLQQAFAKMQQTDSGYIIIGQDGAIEGIVSKSDITKAMSPYLLPIFAKWRRPLDDATLKIRIKWIMSRPVRTIKPETPLATIIEQMSQFRGRCLPVMDKESNVQGLVTAFDIFQALLESNPNTCLIGETAQEPIEPAASTGTK